MKFQFASMAKTLRHRALIFAIVLAIFPILWMSVSFSQDGVSPVNAPTFIPYDAASAGARMAAERTVDGNPIPPNAYQNAMKQWTAIPPSTNLAPKKSAKGRNKFVPLLSGVTGMVWKPIGPVGITGGQAGTSVWNGRVNSIAIDPTNANVIYLGATAAAFGKQSMRAPTGRRLSITSRCLRSASQPRSRSIRTIPTHSMWSYLLFFNR